MGALRHELHPPVVGGQDVHHQRGLSERRPPQKEAMAAGAGGRAATGGA